MARPQAIRSAYKPDWVDVLLAAALASWATIGGAMLVFRLAPMMFVSPMAAVLALFWLLLVYGYFGFLAATLVCTIVGLPALALANLLKLSEWWQASIVGAAAGSLVMLVFPSLPGLGDLDGPSELWFVIAGPPAGVAAWRERAKGRQPT